jgi:hypothetical protein
VRSNPRSNFLRKFSFGSHGKDHLDVATNKEKKKTWIIASSARKTRGVNLNFTTFNKIPIPCLYPGFILRYRLFTPPGCIKLDLIEHSSYFTFLSSSNLI